MPNTCIGIMSKLHIYAHTNKSILPISMAIKARLSHVIPPTPALVHAAAGKEQ